VDGAEAAAQLRSQRGIVTGRSPLYDRLLAGLAGAAERHFDGGTIPRLLAVTGPNGPAESRLLLLAALHHAALADPDLPHAAWYPTARPDGHLPADQGAPAALALAYLVEHEDHVARFIADQRLQTNEIGRCAALLPGLLSAALLGPPLRLIELGASGGLNLRFDRYRFDFQGGPSWGPVGGPELRSRAEGRVPRTLTPPTVEVVERIGVDQNPLDPGDPEDARLLTCFLWPDEGDRHARLAAATTVARSTPIEVVQADLVAHVEEHVDVRPDTVSVLFHSQVRHLLDGDDAARLDEAVNRFLDRGTADAPAAYVSFEAQDETLEGPPTLQVAIANGDGPAERRAIAEADWHGRWVRWH